MSGCFRYSRVNILRDKTGRSGASYSFPWASNATHTATKLRLWLSSWTNNAGMVHRSRRRSREPNTLSRPSYQDFLSLIGTYAHLINDPPCCQVLCQTLSPPRKYLLRHTPFGLCLLPLTCYNGHIPISCPILQNLLLLLAFLFNA